MESDLGTFSPLGLQFTGSDKARAIMKEVMKLLAPINVTSLEEHGEGTDINMWMKAGVPGQFHLAEFISGSWKFENDYSLSYHSKPPFFCEHRKL